MSLLCVFFFPFYSAFSLCGENCSFFVCVCPQSTPLWMTPGAKFRKMVSANNFTLRQISMSLVIFYIFVSFFDLTGKICIAFFECLVFFLFFFASFLATIFALQIQRKCVFLCVFVFKKNLFHDCLAVVCQCHPLSLIDFQLCNWSILSLHPCI